MKSKWNYVFMTTLLLFLKSESVIENDSQSPATLREASQVINYRLPKAIKPTYYDLSVIYRRNFTFYGVVKINATVLERTDEVVLHYGKINVTTITVLINNTKLGLIDADYDRITEKYTVKLNKSLEEGIEILIAIEFNGRVQEGITGFYKVSYDNQGKSRQIATTHFQPIHARHAFPCFDEPAFKAVFKVRLQRPSEYNSLSNMPILSSTSLDDVTNDFYEDSLQMSTYLVAFVISDLTSLSDGNLKIWTRDKTINQAKYALRIGKKCLDYLEYIFGQNYEIPKMDMVALPKLYMNAVENWGLTIHDEKSLLYDEVESSDIFQQIVAESIAHASTHMWFGNLVTPDWWAFLWLSEGFAMYYQFKVVSQIEPTWKMEQQFVLAQQNALGFDALPSSEPMTKSVQNQSEINGMTGAISCYKGGSILRMLELSFGANIFNSAAESYLEARKFVTGRPEDFLARIQVQINSSLDASVEAIMNSWTLQSGYPVLSVSVTNDQVKLKQQRFLLRKSNSVSSVDQTWWIPITWASKSKPNFVKTITDKWINGEKVFKVERKNDDWIIFNVKAAGFYRVNYDKESWYRIIDTLKTKNFTRIHVINRAAIIDDLLNLARANLLDHTIALDGLQYLKQETSYLPFKAAFNSLDYLTRRFSGQAEYSLYAKFVLTLIRSIRQTLGFVDKTGESRFNVLLRRELNLLSCKLALKNCVLKSLNYFNNWRNRTINRIPKNSKQVVYTTAVKHGTSEDWEFLWKQYETTKIVSEKIEIFNALACSQNPDLLEKYLKQKMDGRDLVDILKAISSCSLFGAEFVIDYVEKYYKEVVNANEGDYELIARILSAASQYLSTQYLVDKFEQLIQSHYIDFEPIMPTLMEQLELAVYEVNWYNRNSRKIANWIKNQQEFNSEISLIQI